MLTLEILEERCTPAGSWSHEPITYSFSNLGDGLDDLSYAQVRSAIEQALDTWAQAADLTFKEIADVGPTPSRQVYQTQGAADIRISKIYLDGVENKLYAYAYYPIASNKSLAGDIFFDKDENWALRPSEGVDLRELALHEIGHSLGLEHIDNPGATMYPYYQERFPGDDIWLSLTDINNIQKLYPEDLPDDKPSKPKPPKPTQTVVVQPLLTYVPVHQSMPKPNIGGIVWRQEIAVFYADLAFVLISLETHHLFYTM